MGFQVRLSSSALSALIIAFAINAVCAMRPSDEKQLNGAPSDFEGPPPGDPAEGLGEDDPLFKHQPAEDDALKKKYDPIQVGAEMIPITEHSQSLIPRVGRCYFSYPYLLPALRLWRQRRQFHALRWLQDLIDAKGADSEETLMAEHMTVEIAQLSDNYTTIDVMTRKILARDPENLHALFVRALYTACALNTGNQKLLAFSPTGELEPIQQVKKKSEATKEAAVQNTDIWVKLAEVSPHFTDALESVVKRADQSWDGEFLPSGIAESTKVLKAKYPGQLIIVVFGWYPILGNETVGYTPLAPLRERVKAAFLLSKHFPTATIIPVGGMTEGTKAEGPWIKEDMIRKNTKNNGGKVDPEYAKRFAVFKGARDSIGNSEFVAEFVRDTLCECKCECEKDQEKGSLATVLLVASDWQQPRCHGILESTFARRNMDVKVVGVGVGMAWNSGATNPRKDKQLANWIATEQTAIYRDLARASALYRFCDFVEDTKEEEEKSQAATSRTIGCFLYVLALACATSLMQALLE